MEKVKKLTKTEFAVLIFVAVGLAMAITLTVQSLFAPEAPTGLTEAERKTAFEEAIKKGTLSVEDARYWRVVESEEK